MNELQKRHQFQPGKSGNPGGRPPSKLNKLLSRHLRARDGDATREQKLVEQVYGLALAGDMRAVALIWDRMEGKITETEVAELTGGNSGPVIIRMFPADCNACGAKKRFEAQGGKGNPPGILDWGSDDGDPLK